MNYLTLNIRGLGDSDKATWIRDLKRTHKLNFLCFQETKIGDIDARRISPFWGRGPLDFDLVNPTGRSGGLLNIWDPSLFTKISSASSRHFLLTSGKLKGINSIIHILNIYAPQDLSAKRTLWNDVLNLKESNPGIWIVLGDFNAVRSPEDRKNSNFDPISAGDFNDFIANADLSEFVLKGRKYTYATKNGRKLSRIDRILVCPEFLNHWSEACYSALPRFLSDHAPLILTTTYQDFGPVPFKLFNSWMSRPDFDSLILKANEEFVFNGSPDQVFLEKLKYFKAIIKNWAKANKIKDEEQEVSLLHELEDIDKIMEIRPLNEDEEWILGECKTNLAELEDKKSKDLWQKSRASWASQGDDNTSYFHGIINKKNSQNRIHGVTINGIWNSNPKLIKREVRKFFHKRFKEDIPNRPSFICQNIKKLSMEDSEFLITPFLEAEIKNAVWDCGDDRAWSGRFQHSIHKTILGHLETGPYKFF